MSEEEIKNSIGLKILADSSDGEAKPRDIIGEWFSGEDTELNEDDEYISLGKFDLLSLPEDDLYSYAMEKNKRIIKLLLRQGEILSKYDFTSNGFYGYVTSTFLGKLLLPNLCERIEHIKDDKRLKGMGVDLPHRREVAKSYGIDNRDIQGVHGMSVESLGTSFLIPTLSSYINNYADTKENREKEKNGVKGNFQEGFTANKAGWKRLVTECPLPSSHFFSIPLKFYVPREPFKRHAYITGGSGSGKSELIKLLVHHQLKESMKNWTGAVVIDPHGDLVQEISKFKECLNNERVIYFDPQLYPDRTPCIDLFNPPDLKDSTIDTMAQNICDAISEIVADSSISAQMRTILIPCITILLRRPKSTLTDLQRFMMDEFNGDLIELGINSKNQGQSNFFKQGFKQKNYDPTKKSIYTRLQTLLNSTVFRRMLHHKATIDIESELDKGSVVLFNLSKTMLGDDVSSAFGRLVVAQIKNIGFRRQLQSKSKRVSSYIYIDECQNYISESIETTLTELRKYGIHMILASQVVGQNMSSQLTNIVLSNTAVKLIGYNGDKSLKIMSNETGAPLEELKKLTVGRFFCKLKQPKKHTEAFSFKAPTHLIGARNSADPIKWREQKRKGYVLNKTLDKIEEKEGVKGIKINPDYIEPDQAPQKKERKPKFKL